MLKLAFALLALAPAPAVPQTVMPPDPVARAKFPNDNPEQIDALANFNKLINRSLTYVSDQDHYGAADHYVSMPPDGKGDCEDYALTKMEMLGRIGFPVITNAKLVMVMVPVGKQTSGHAILAILLKSGAVAYLDMAGEPMTRAELVAKGYQFFDWRA
jgi:predicted transglutaminase-like cysteine proteinase